MVSRPKPRTNTWTNILCVGGGGLVQSDSDIRASNVVVVVLTPAPAWATVPTQLHTVPRYVHTAVWVSQSIGVCVGQEWLLIGGAEK